MSIRTTRVYPVEGRRIRHPETGELIPPEGLEVPRGGYWLRRILDGDLTEAPPAPPVPVKTKKEKEAPNADHV
jgi:hypothetical protein